jgi:5'-3' exonuclease
MEMVSVVLFIVWKIISREKSEFLFIWVNKMILSQKLPVLLIDTSYFIFYRYYSSLKWYQFKNKEINYETIDQDDVFMTAFFKHILDDFKKLCKKWKTNMSQMVFCCDCSRDKIWRNEFIDAYKQTRITHSTFNSQIFFRFYQYLEEHQQDWKINIISQDHLEADDIAYLMKQLLLKHEFTNEIIIITNDNDYLQLLDPQTKLINLNPKNNDLSIRSCGDPQKDLKIKLIMGDKVDNIKAIHPGIGQKVATKLASLSEEDFEKYMVTKNCKENYEKNKKIIAFSEIPKDLQEIFFTTHSIQYYD